MKSISPKENPVLWSIVCAISSKLLTKRASAYKFHYLNPKTRWDLQSQKTISLHITLTISLNIQIDKFLDRSDLETTILASFPSNCLNYAAITLFLQKLSTSTIAKFIIAARTAISLQRKVKYLRAITMCSAFNPDCRYDNSSIKLIGNMFCPKTICSDILSVHKKTFQSLERSDHLSSMSSMLVHVSGAQHSL